MSEPGAGEASPASDRWLGGTLKIWLAASALFLVLSGPGIYYLEFPDPDDALRLAQVRDLIAGQGWFDLHQYRSDPAHGGVLMHWSRLVDMPLATLILLLRPVLGQPLAEQVTMALVPLLMLGAAMVLIARLGHRWLGERSALFACIALAVSVPALEQLRPLRIDHHGWQIIAILVAVNALFARSARVGGWVAGAAMAFCLSVSLEGLPFTAALMGVTALRWLRDRDERAWAVHMTSSFALLSPLLYLATRGPVDFSAYCDIVSPVHLAIFAWGAIGVGALAALNPRRVPVLLAGLGAIGAVAVAIAATAAPQCIGGAFGQLTPMTRELWYDRVHEGLPIWHQSLPVLTHLIVAPAIALQAAVRLALAADDPARKRQLTEYALLLAAAIAISLMVARAGSVAASLAAVPLGWQLARWIDAITQLRRPSRQILAGGALAIALVPAAPLSMARGALPANNAAADYTDLVDVGGRCGLEKLPLSIAELPTGHVLAPLDLGPQLLAMTEMSVVATGHHRGNEAMSDVMRAFLLPPEQAHAVARRLKADYVIFCPTQTEVLNYRDLRPDGLANVLATGRAPSWLAPVPLAGEKTKYRVWRVVD